MINEQELAEIRESAKSIFNAFISGGFKDYFTMQYQKTSDSQFYIIVFDNKVIKNNELHDKMEGNKIDQFLDYGVYLYVINQ